MATNPHASLPASDEPDYEIDSFELLWERHKGRIIAGAIALVVIAVAAVSWLAISAARTHAAEAAFAAAKTPADYEAVISKFGFSPVAGDAALLLAKAQRDEKKFDAANATLNQFLASQPEHPLAPVAKIAAAENLALAGKVDEAVQAFTTLAQTDSKTFVAPYALNLAAELRAAQGKREDALKIYRELQQAYPTSISAQISRPAAESLEAVLGK